MFSVNVIIGGTDGVIRKLPVSFDMCSSIE